MQTKWQIYFQHLRRKTLKGFLLWLPGTIVFFTALNYATSGGKAPLGPLAVTCAAYSLGIQLGMFVVFTIYWTFATALGERALRHARNRLVPYFVLSFIGLGVGVLAAEHGLAYLRGDAIHESDWTLGTFFTGALLSAAMIFREAYYASRSELRDLAAQTTEAKYATLKSQMQPHFLFNSLNSLSELIEEEPARATRMTEGLATLYRQVLANSKDKTSPLASEVAIARAYLDLERLRFGQRLTYTFTVAVADAATQALHVPSLMLQTLVENAVKHGVAPALAGGRVAIEVTPETGCRHRLTVRNSGHPFAPGRADAGTGLENTVKRLDLLYGEAHGFRIGTNGAGETEASFCVSGDRIV